MSDDDLQQLDQVYADARAEDIFLVEPATGLAAAGRLALLRQLEAEIGRPVPLSSGSSGALSSACSRAWCLARATLA